MIDTSDTAINELNYVVKSGQIFNWTPKMKEKDQQVMEMSTLDSGIH